MSGLSQDIASMDISGAPPGLERGSGTPEHINIIELKDDMLKVFIEQEVIQLMPMSDASAVAGMRIPGTWVDLKGILDKLGYGVDAQDNWQVLGMAMLDGADPNLYTISGRKRAAQLLCGLASVARWAPADVQAAQNFSARVGLAAVHCESTLDTALAQRRKLKVSKLPLHKELGAGAFAFLQAVVPTGTHMRTQWSDVLRLGLQNDEAIAKARRLANLAEKGDEKIWPEIQGQDVVLWAPADGNALTRLLSQFLKRTAPDQRPSSLCLIVAIPLLTGMHSIENILDLWSTALLSEKWSSIVRRTTFTTTPMDMVMSGAGTPRHGRYGLGIFELRHNGDKCPPRMLEPAQAAISIDDVRYLSLDLRALDLAKVMSLLSLEGFQRFTPRAPNRSPLSTSEIPRLCMHWLIPDDFSDAEVLVLLRYHRGTALPEDTCYGLKSMFSCRDSLILEFDSPYVIQHYWALSSQMIPFSSRRALVYTHTAAEIWTSVMDRVMGEDVKETSVKLRWRASKHGGRTFAAPSATTKALAASRRRGTAPLSIHNYMADVEVKGEIGKEDGRVLALLMQHAITATGIQLQETDYNRAPKTGEFIHLATQNSSAPPGRLRVLLSTAEEVRRLYNALHGKTVQVGADRVGVVVENDLIDGKGVPGNGLRSWA